MLLILVGAFGGLYAYAGAGGMHSWREFSVHRLVQKELLFAIGGPFILLLGVGLANKGSRIRLFLGALLAIAAGAVALTAASSHQTRQAIPQMIVLLILAVASAVTSARKKTRCGDVGRLQRSRRCESTPPLRSASMGLIRPARRAGR